MLFSLFLFDRKLLNFFMNLHIVAVTEIDINQYIFKIYFCLFDAGN